MAEMDRRRYQLTVDFLVPESVDLGPGVVVAEEGGVPPVLQTLATGLWPIERLRLEQIFEIPGESL